MIVQEYGRWVPLSQLSLVTEDQERLNKYDTLPAPNTELRGYSEWVGLWAGAMRKGWSRRRLMSLGTSQNGSTENICLKF